MTAWSVVHEAALRLGAFAAILAVMAVWEVLGARRALSQSPTRRWFANLGLSAVDALVVRLAFPAAAVGIALVVEGEGWGLLPRLDLSAPVAFGIAVLALDLAIYLQHVLFHAVPALWRFHRVHHSDQDVDCSTGVRFHPVEIMLSLGIKAGVIAALGASPAAVLVFEMLLNATSVFNHGNVRLQKAADRWLRWILVTPDMHRVHHSLEIDETNSNFGFNLPWWDRLFGTYRDQPRVGHRAMRLGVEELLVPKPRHLVNLLALPFSSETGRYPVARREAPDSSGVPGTSGDVAPAVEEPERHGPCSPGADS